MSIVFGSTEGPQNGWHRPGVVVNLRRQVAMPHRTPEERRASADAARRRYRANPVNLERERTQARESARIRRAALAVARPPDRFLTLNLKTCSACGSEKPATFEHFFRSKKGRGGFSAHCRDCDHAKRVKFTEHRPTYQRDYHLLHAYGISAERYAELMADQDGRCGACGKAPTGDALLCVDHDHDCCPGTLTCGKCVRGLLCRTCNGIEGQLRTGRIEGVLRYLERATCRV